MLVWFHLVLEIQHSLMKCWVNWVKSESLIDFIKNCKPTDLKHQFHLEKLAKQTKFIFTSKFWNRTIWNYQNGYQLGKHQKLFIFLRIFCFIILLNNVHILNLHDLLIFIHFSIRFIKVLDYNFPHHTITPGARCDLHFSK